jgi:hypothetical protein
VLPNVLPDLATFAGNSLLSKHFDVLNVTLKVALHGNRRAFSANEFGKSRKGIDLHDLIGSIVVRGCVHFANYDPWLVSVSGNKSSPFWKDRAAMATQIRMEQ